MLHAIMETTSLEGGKGISKSLSPEPERLDCFINHQCAWSNDLGDQFVLFSVNA